MAKETSIPRGAIKRFRELLNREDIVSREKERAAITQRGGVMLPGGSLRPLDKTELTRVGMHVGPSGTRYAQLKRPYGDYMYAQDRDKFMVDLREWLEKGQPDHL